MNWAAVLVASTLRSGLRYRLTQTLTSFRVRRQAGRIRPDFYSLGTLVGVRNPQKPELVPRSIPSAPIKTEQAVIPGCTAI